MTNQVLEIKKYNVINIGNYNSKFIKKLITDLIE